MTKHATSVREVVIMSVRAGGCVAGTQQHKREACDDDFPNSKIIMKVSHR